MRGTKPRGIDHSIPVPAFEARQPVVNFRVTIADDLLEVREHVGVGPATIEQCDLVAAVDRELHGVRTEEPRTAKEQYSPLVLCLRERRTEHRPRTRRSPPLHR